MLFSTGFLWIPMIPCHIIRPDGVNSTLILPISSRMTKLALGQSYHCLSSIEKALNNMSKRVTWIYHGLTISWLVSGINYYLWFYLRLTGGNTTSIPPESMPTPDADPGVRSIVGVNPYQRPQHPSSAQWPLLLTWFNFNPSMDK